MCQWEDNRNPDVGNGLSLSFLSYLAGSKSVSVLPSARLFVGPSDPEMMTYTALDAIASLSGQKLK